MCTKCYGNHFGLCTACTDNAVLFNQMCIAMPYYAPAQLQMYYTAANNVGDLMGGQVMCGGLLYEGPAISL
jgi:hypothetical protein